MALQSFEIENYTLAQVAALLPVPAADTNKYVRGKVALVAGCTAYPGAACLAAGASARAGAGYTQVVCAPATVPIVQGYRPSVVATSWDALEAEGAVRRAKAVVLGAGFDAADEMCAAVTLAVLNSWALPDVPALVDGGALGVIATPEGRRALRNRTAQKGPTVLTPHEREAARLALPLGLDLPKDSQDEEGQAYLAKGLALYYGSVVTLKGPVTFISDGERVIRMSEGTPALAKAGTGDVLAGMIGALLAQGLTLLDAAVVGATWHALAGRKAAEDLTDICVTAEDVIAAIPRAAQTLLELR